MKRFSPFMIMTVRKAVCRQTKCWLHLDQKATESQLTHYVKVRKKDLKNPPPQRHTSSSKATLPSSATPFGGHFLSNHHERLSQGPTQPYSVQKKREQHLEVRLL